jgi:hypothetical protein
MSSKLPYCTFCAAGATRRRAGWMWQAKRRAGGGGALRGPHGGGAGRQGPREAGVPAAGRGGDGLALLTCVEACSGRWRPCPTQPVASWALLAVGRTRREGGESSVRVERAASRAWRRPDRAGDGDSRAAGTGGRRAVRRRMRRVALPRARAFSNSAFAGSRRMPKPSSSSQSSARRWPIRTRRRSQVVIYHRRPRQTCRSPGSSRNGPAPHP